MANHLPFNGDFNRSYYSKIRSGFSQRYFDSLYTMLMDSGGNAGTQSSTTIITALYSGEVNYRELFKVIFKELKIGMIAGFALVIVNMLRMFVLDGVSLQVNLTVSITLLLTIVLSKIIGGILPLIAEKIKIDPTIMAGPLITTIVDTFVLLVYFEVASLLLSI